MLIKLTRKENDRRQFAAALLLSPFAKILSGLLFAGLLGSVGFSGYTMWKNKSLQVDIAELKADVSSVTSRLDTCLVELKDQNGAVITVAADAAADVAVFETVNDQLVKTNKIYEDEIKRLKNRPPPESCEASKDWLRDNLDIFEDTQ